MTVIINLTKGRQAIIDDDDAHLAAFKWCVTIKSRIAYAVRSIMDSAGKRRSVYLHREVLGLKSGERLVVDHIDGDGLNNRRSNLRAITHRENIRNVVGPRRDNTTGYLGVYRVGSRFQAKIMTNGSYKNLGMFATPDEANVARLAAEAELWGIQPRRSLAFCEANQT